MNSCRYQRGLGGSRPWNSSIRICPPCSVTYDAARKERQMRKYRASSSAPDIGTLNTPRITTCASGVTISAASSNRLMPRTALRTPSRNVCMEAASAKPRHA